MTGIVLNWKGVDYTIPASKAFAVGEQVEDVLSMADIAAMGTSPKFFKIARAFGVMLRFAGCKVSDDEVHREITASLMQAGKVGSAEQVFAAEALRQLSAVLTMGMSEAVGDTADAGETPAQPMTSD